MGYLVVLKNNEEFEAVSNKTILESALDSRVSLEYSCQTGRCKICMCTLLEGSVLPGKDDSLSDEERELNKILTCQAIPTSNIKVDIEELGAYADLEIKNIPVKISKIDFLSKNIVKLTLRSPPSNCLIFIPGQYIKLAYKDINRSYSIANSQREDYTIDLIIKRVEDGKMSDFIFNTAAINDLLRIEGPFGTFGWRENLPKTIILLATGTGIAPILSLIESQYFDQKNLYLYWGNRAAEDFFDLPPNVEKKVKLTKVISRNNKETDCKKRYVQDMAVNDHNNDLSEAAVYACGLLEMIEDAKQLFLKNGLPDDRFFSDAFVSSGEV